MQPIKESNTDRLYQKARVLEQENVRLSKKVAELLRENLALKGMATEQVELNLPGLCEQAAGNGSGLTKPGSERRQSPKRNNKKREQKGHGPTEQKELPIVEEAFDLDEADKICPDCGGHFDEWEDHEDQTEVIDVIERKWVIKKCSLKKYRCKCGCIDTAEGPTKIIKGGRYTPEVAINTATGKYLDHLPLERQVRMAKRQGAKLTNQTLWDQIAALAKLHTPLYDRILEHILSQTIIGVDESPFKLIKKGGSEKWQAWELSCPSAIYFAIMPAKSAEMGAQLLANYQGTMVVDGAPTYESLARIYSIILAYCWSHTRRKVLEAAGEAPGQVQEFLDMVGDLYAIDRKASSAPPGTQIVGGYRQGVNVELLGRLRDTESRKVIKRIEKWILNQKCIPGGKLKRSLEYVARHWTGLSKFLDNPLIPLDNNRTEGGYIGMALGRRNYIGARSVLGTEVAAKFYTIFESTKLCGGDPEAYLRYATYALLRGEEPLLPHEWVNFD